MDSGPLCKCGVISVKETRQLSTSGSLIGAHNHTSTDVGWSSSNKKNPWWTHDVAAGSWDLGLRSDKSGQEVAAATRRFNLKKSRPMSVRVLVTFKGHDLGSRTCFYWCTPGKSPRCLRVVSFFMSIRVLVASKGNGLGCLFLWCVLVLFYFFNFVLFGPVRCNVHKKNVWIATLPVLVHLLGWILVVWFVSNHN